MSKVHFKSVGRSRAEWSAEFKGITHNGVPTEHWLRRQVRPHLMSRDLHFELHANGIGIIYAGFREVGTYLVESLVNAQ